MLLCERKGCIGVSGALDEGSTRVLMPEVCKLISSLASQPHGTLHAEKLLKQLDEPIAKEGVPFSFSHVLEEILAVLSRALMDLKGKDSSSSVSLQSTLGLLLCLLRFPTAKADLVTAKRKGAEMKENGDTLREVGSTILEILMVALANHSDVSAPERVSPIPEYFSLALLFLRELLDSSTALLSDSSDCDEQVHATASVERFISLAHSSGTFVRDKEQVKLMYDVCMGILRGPTVDSHESGQERAEVLWKEEGNGDLVVCRPHFCFLQLFVKQRFSFWRRCWKGKHWLTNSLRRTLADWILFCPFQVAAYLLHRTTFCHL